MSIITVVACVATKHGFSCNLLAYLVVTIPAFELWFWQTFSNHTTLQHQVTMSQKSPQKSELPAIIEIDIEQSAHDTSYLNNSVVQNLAWSDVTVTVPDRETKLPKQILSAGSGYVAAGKSRPSYFQVQNLAMVSISYMLLYLHILTLNRRNDGDNGSLGLRQNDPT